MKLAILPCCAAIALAGCSYTIMRHEGGVDYDQLARTMPRAPLRVAYSSAHPGHARSRGILAVLTEHPMLDVVDRADAEVLVNFEAVTCYTHETGGPLQALLSTVLLPVILVANPFPYSDQDCTIQLTYSVPAVPAAAGGRSFGYRFNVKRQTQALLYPLYTSAAREAYQQEYLDDQVVAKLLLEVETHLRADVRSSR